jgi:hypothetical protein
MNKLIIIIIIIIIIVIIIIINNLYLIQLRCLSHTKLSKLENDLL